MIGLQNSLSTDKNSSTKI